MENYKKEKSSKRHLKIDVVQDKETVSLKLSKVKSLQ